jgi:CHAT domain-containing protein/Tfp pilus assembly protein PilF
MRSLFAIMVLLLSAGGLVHAQSVEKAREVGEDGLTIEDRIAADDGKISFTASGKTFALFAKKYVVKLAGGKTYKITMRSKDVDSLLVLHDSKGRQVGFDDDSGGGFDAEFTLSVKEDQDYRIHAATLKGVGAFSLTVREESFKPHDPDFVHVVGKKELSLEGRIAADDAKTKVTLEDGSEVGMPAKRYSVKLAAGKSYFLTMGSSAIDSFLIIQDQDGNQVDYDDDSGGGLNAALTLDVKADTVFRIYAAAVSKTGSFRLVIRERLPSDPPALNQADRSSLIDAMLLNVKAKEFNDRGDAKSAIRLSEEALAIRKRLLGEENPLTVQAMSNVGALLEARGRLPEARLHFERALAIRKKTLGEEHPDTANSMINLGSVLQDQGDFAAARPLYERALEVNRKVLGEHDPGTSRSLNSLGTLFTSLGDLGAAQRCFQQAYDIQKSIHGEGHIETASSLNNLGFLLNARGDLAAARSCYEQVLAIRRKTQGEQHPDTAGALVNLGALFHDQGDLATARSCYEQALAIHKKVLGQEHPETAATLNSLALVIDEQGDLTAARSYFERALAIRKKVLGEEHPETALSLICLGQSLKDDDQLIAARACFEQALAIQRKAYGEEHPDTAQSLNSLGTVLQSQGELAAARSCYEQALAIYRKNGRWNTSVMLGNLGLVLQDQGDLTGARRYYEQALEVQQRALALAAEGLGERSQLAMSESVSVRLDDLLSLSARTNGSASDDFKAVLAWQGAVTDRQQQIRIARRDPALVPLTDRLREVTVRLANLALAVPDPKQAESNRAELVRLTETREKLQGELDAKSAAFRNARRFAEPTPAAIAQALPSETALVSFLEYWNFRPDANAKGKRLWEHRLTAFVVAPGRPVVRVELGPVAKIASAVEDWRRQVIRRSTPGESADDAGPTLRRLVWTPLEKHLAGARAILISPDGVTARIPFAALPGKAAGAYLLEDVTITVLPLPRWLPKMATKATAVYDGDPSLLLVGDVDYGGSTGKSEVVASRAAARSGEGPHEFQRLPQTKAEIVAIRTAFSGRFPRASVTMLERSAATESAVRKEAALHRYVHVAAHGFFAGTEIVSATAPVKRRQFDLFGNGDVRGFHPSLLSGIVLAGANRIPTPGENPGEDDGILTAMEVETIDLARTELVVLSACETGLGKTAGGEGILGLQRAFQVAGAGSVVASLWSVDDDATRLLMTRFYDNLWTRKMPRAEALREAQLFLLREAPRQGLLRGVPRLDAPQPLPAADRRTSPFYWAAFVLSGDWR